MGLEARLFLEGAKHAGKKIKDAFSDEAYKALAEAWERNFPNSKISEKDLYNILASEAMQDELEKFEETGKFDEQVLADKIEALSQDYEINIRDGEEIAKAVLDQARTLLPMEQQMMIQTRILQRQQREKQSSDGRVIELEEDITYEKSETVYSNFFRVMELPANIKSAETEYRNKGRVYDKFGQGLDDFILRNGRLYTFSSLGATGNPLNNAIDGEIETTPVGKWKSEKDKKRYLIALLNSNLKSKFYDVDAAQHPSDYNKHTYFFPLKDQNKKLVAIWNPTKKSKRTISKPLGGGFVHKGVEAKFTFVDDEIYLLLHPTKCYTEDGYNPVNRKLKNKLSSKSQSFDRNRQVLYDVKFWSCLLSGGDTTITLDSIEVYAKSESFRMGLSREEDYFGSSFYESRSKVYLEEREVETNEGE